MPELEAAIAALLAAAPGPETQARCVSAWAAGLRDGEAAGLAALRDAAEPPPTPPAARRERPADRGCWWLGIKPGQGYKPVMGRCKAGEELPAEARYWAAEGAAEWLPVGTTPGG